jgi:zinc transporter ZupT
MGWAAGAMLWVAVAELLAEAATELGQIQAGIITAAAAAAMFVLQELVR